MLPMMIAALLEVLLLQHAVELLALDHRVGAVADQVGHQHVRDALADVLVVPEQVQHVLVDRRVIEIEHRDAALGSLGHQRRHDRGRERQEGNRALHERTPSGDREAKPTPGTGPRNLPPRRPLSALASCRLGA